jgi:hypothetical protein
MAVLVCMGTSMLSTPACAEWSRVARSSRGVYYLNEQSIRDTPKGRMAFQLLNLKEPDQQGYRSYTFLYEYQCARGRTRFVRSESFEGHMGEGPSTVDNEPLLYFTTPKSGTVESKIARLVCGAAMP